MRIAWCFLALVLAAGVHAQSAGSKMTPELYQQMLDDMHYWDSQADRYAAIEKRAMDLYPARRNAPLRYLNITDEEIREVEFYAQKYLPRAYVNISPVVDDCPCEEGPLCASQVYVVAATRDKTRGLQLSRIKDHWDIGVVQEWWMRREAVVPQHTGNRFLDWYLMRKAVTELYEEFPVCAAKIAPAKQAANTPKPEKK